MVSRPQTPPLVTCHRSECSFLKPMIPLIFSQRVEIRRILLANKCPLQSQNNLSNSAKSVFAFNLSTSRRRLRPVFSRLFLNNTQGKQDSRVTAGRPALCGGGCLGGGGQGGQVLYVWANLRLEGLCPMRGGAPCPQRYGGSLNIDSFFGK